VLSINKTKAEAQQLIKQYNKLQAEAKKAISPQEAARKASEAENLISKINAMQVAITKFQTEKKATTANIARTTNSQDVKKTSSFEERMYRLEEAQKKTRKQIEQLTQTKEELGRLLEREKKLNTGGRGTTDNKLQEDLTKLIKKKELEQENLIQELEAVRQQSQKENERFRLQRDAARSLIERQKEFEKEKIRSFYYYRGRKKLLIGLSIVIILIAGVLWILPKYNPDIFLNPLSAIYQTPIPEPQIETNNAVKAKPKVVAQLRALAIYRDLLKQGGQGPIMLKLPGGTFQMGAKNTSLNYDERPQHQVTLNSFSISQYEITFEEYDLFAWKTGRSFPNDNGWGREKRPVINVDWYDAYEYTKWLTSQTGHQYRLPSEREWEYAAKAGSKTFYWWGYEVGKNKANCGVCGSIWDGKKTAPVGSFQPNAFQLYDTIGNVMEWTISCYRRSYSGAPSVGNRWLGGNCSRRVARSSSYRTYINNLHTTKRNNFNPKTRIDILGFRVVRVD
jgi:formylglycine-generating enzyme required for sulfatase activity